MGAVITTRHIADQFSNGMEYFNTTGGSTMSCVIGLAVLHELKSNNYMENAITVGKYMINQLTQLQSKYPCIGDVRGMGLMIGIELVCLIDDDGDNNDESADTTNNDNSTNQSNNAINDSSVVPPPDAKLAKYCVDYMKRYDHILCGTDGIYHNVIKFKPPMCFTCDNVNTVINSLRLALTSYDNIR